MKTYVKMITYTLITFTLFSEANAAGNNQRYQSKDCPTPKKENICAGPRYEKERPTKCGYSAPARWNPTCDWDFFFTASFVYWYAVEDGLTLGKTVNSDAIPKEEVINHNFEYKPGVRASFGTNFGHDNWTATAEYTRFHMSTKAFKTIPDGSNSNLQINKWWETFFTENTTVNNVTARWNLHVDVLDGELARDYYLGRMAIFKPFMGLRGAWIDQRYSAFFFLPPSTGAPQDKFPAKWRSDSWAVGPRLGFDIGWELFYGFRLTGAFASSWLYHNQKVSGRNVNSNNAFSYQAKWNNRVKAVRPNTEFGMGLAWGSYFKDQAGHLNISAAYEFHYWWSENVMAHTAEIIGNEYQANIPCDLMYHGLTLTLRLDF